MVLQRLRGATAFAAGMTLFLSACASAPVSDGPSVAGSTSREPPAAAASNGVLKADVDSANASASAPATMAAPAARVPQPRKPLTPDMAVVQPAGLPTSKASPHQMVAHFINVGQGDATLLEFSCGAVLIDTGGENNTDVPGAVGREHLKAYLEAFFKRRPDLAWTLNLVVLSHPHKDHTDGVSVLLGQRPEITIENVVDNGVPSAHDSGAKGQRDLQAYAKTAQIGYLAVKESDVKTTVGFTNDVIDPIDCSGSGGVDPQLAALWGRVGISAAWAKDPNNNSVVFRVGFGNASMLFMGDLEEEAINAMLESYSADISIFDIDVLKVGHHGSKNATNRALVDAVTPTIAVVMSGDKDLSRAQYSAFNFGHPNLAAIKLLTNDDTGVTAKRTPQTVDVGINGRSPDGKVKPKFTTYQLSKGLYDSSWDGDIAVTLKDTGEISVETSH